MKRSSTLLIAVFSLTMMVSTAFSQNVFETTRQILERTDMIIKEAQQVVQSTNYPAVNVILGSAIGLQNQAWSIFHTATANELSVVKRLSLEARDLAKDAIAGARISEQNEATLLSKLEHVQDLLDRATDLVSANPGQQQGAAVVEAVRTNLNRAWELYRDGQYRVSLKVCNQIEQTMRKIISIATENQRNAAQFERRAEFVRKGIERVEGTLAECKSETAPGLLDRARRTFELAAELYTDNKPVMAMKALQNARKLTDQASRECRGSQTMTNRYDHLLTRTEQLNEQVMPSDEHGRKLLGMIYEQLELAAGYIESDQSVSAAAALKAADLMLGQLKRHLNDSGI